MLEHLILKKFMELNIYKILKYYYKLITEHLNVHKNKDDAIFLLNESFVFDFVL